MLTFQHDESIEKIYGIKEIIEVYVEIAPLRKSKRAPECKKFLAFRYT